MIIYTIYLITNKINNKKYVGQTRLKPSIRFRKHINGSGCLVSKAIDKYGKENFKFEVIYQTLNIDQIDFLECHFIREHNSLSHSGGIGYNIEYGGNYCKNVSEETRKKLSILGMGEKNSMFGKFHSEETKRNISASRLGSK